MVKSQLVDAVQGGDYNDLKLNKEGAMLNIHPSWNDIGNFLEKRDDFRATIKIINEASRLEVIVVEGGSCSILKIVLVTFEEDITSSSSLADIRATNDHMTTLFRQLDILGSHLAVEDTSSLVLTNKPELRRLLREELSQ